MHWGRRAARPCPLERSSQRRRRNHVRLRLSRSGLAGQSFDQPPPFLSSGVRPQGAAGSNKAAMLTGLGTSSCSSPSRLAVKSTEVKTTPVTLPPGRLRLPTNPLLTRSPPLTNTIGIVVVAAMASQEHY